MEEITEKVTSLSFLLESSFEETVKSLEEDSIMNEFTDEHLLKLFFDGNNTIIERIIYLQYLLKNNPQLGGEAINKITSMFSFSPTCIFRNLLKEISLTHSIDVNIRLECGRVIYDDDKELGYECFNSICNDIGELPIPLQIDVVKILLETEKYYYTVFKRMQYILTNKNIECEYRYKTLQSIQNSQSESLKKTVDFKNSQSESLKETGDFKNSQPTPLESFIIECYLTFFRDNNTYTVYKILSAQYILQKMSLNIKEVEDTIKSFCLDNTLDYNLRADSADLLLRLGSEESKLVGRDIITLLGRNPDGISTVYNNRQNVHDDNIEKSIKKFILYLSSIRTETRNGEFITFEDCVGEIDEIINKVEELQIKKDTINGSLLRISIDQTIYEGGQTLKSIFTKVWRLILSHSFSEILKGRMIEELIDMGNTCSSGHLSRIVNVLCGFEIEGQTFNIDIGWKKQIQSNLIARLTKCIKDIQDEDTRDTILDEMGTSGDIITKKNLSKFFRDNLLPIRDELYKEFVDGKYITSDEFEEHFRSAIEFFEEG